MTPVELLMVARYLMHVPEWWWQGEYNINIKKTCLLISVDEASYLCKLPIGAQYDAQDLIGKAIQADPKQGIVRQIINFNDSHTHQECLEVFDRAIALGEAA